MIPVFHLMNPSNAAAAWAKGVTTGVTAMAPWAWVAREHPQHTETLLDWALQERVARIVVWGGDGTFHRVVAGLWRRKALDRVELALVPAGTCNDLARRLGLSKYFWRRWENPRPEGRLAALSLARLAWRDAAGAAAEDVFVNNAGFGRPRASFDRKDGPWAVMRAFTPLRVSAESPEGRWQGLYYMMLACNAPYFSGGLHFESDVSPEDGVLSVYFVPATSKARLGLRLLRGRLGLPLFDGKVTKIRTTRLSLETDVPVWPQADGEPPPREGVRRLEFAVLPDRVRVWVADKFDEPTGGGTS